MMKCVWRAACAAGLGLVFVAADPGTARGQVGAPAAAPAAAPAGGGLGTGVLPGGAVAPAAAPKEGFVKRCCALFDECRRKLCATPAGQMLNGMTRPATAFTGGVIPPFCPLMPSAKDLGEPGVSGAAAAAMKEALEAKKRREAVRFLGTLDCRYFPDAAQALAMALRMDSSECVRWEAALGLGHGCCCNQITLAALEASVSGTDRDGNPAERSVRVRCAAAAALERCLACYTPPPADEPEKKDKEEKKDVEMPPPGEAPPPGTGPKTGDPLPAPAPLPKGVTPNAKRDIHKDAAPGKLTNKPPTREAVEHARQTLAAFHELLAASAPASAVRPLGTNPGRQSVYHLMKDTGADAPLMSSVTIPGRPVMVSATAPSPAPTPTAAANPKSVFHFLKDVASGSPAAPAKQAAVAPAPAAVLMTPAPVSPVPPPMSPEPARISTPAAPVQSSTPAITSASLTPPPASPVATPAATDEVAGLAWQVVKGATPADRHAAIRQLVRFEWRQHPVVASALLAGAKADPTDTVRVDCLRHLAAQRVNHPHVMTELGAMSTDPDPQVRHEAAQVLALLRQMP